MPAKNSLGSNSLLEEWNGKSFFLNPGWIPPPDIELFTDASEDIMWKELYAVLVSYLTRGNGGAKLRIRLYCDNALNSNGSVLYVEPLTLSCSINDGTCRAPQVMTLIRELFFVCARCNFTLSAQHIGGSCNAVADWSSRYEMQRFRYSPHSEDVSIHV